MPHEVIVVSRRREFHAIVSRLLGDQVRPTPADQRSPERAFDGRSLTLVLDVRCLYTHCRFEQLHPLPLRLPAIVVLALSHDDDEAISAMTVGIPPHPAEDLKPGCLARAASPSLWPFDYFVRMGRVAAVRLHVLLAAGCGVPSLTAREAETLLLVQHGLSNRDIASRLVVEVQTVKNYVHQIRQKTNAGSRYELIAQAAPPARELPLTG